MNISRITVAPAGSFVAGAHFSAGERALGSRGSIRETARSEGCDGCDDERRTHCELTIDEGSYRK